MRKIHAAGSLAAALAFACGMASAQSQPSAPPGPPAGPPGNYQKTQPLILEKQQLGTTAYANAARARMRNGDCAGALDVFDAAIASSIDTSLRRDRGLCHEQLGHAYAAIDDYRAYLTAEPDAADSEGIRGRLGRLEQATTGRSSTGDDSDVPPAGGSGVSASVSVGTGADGHGQVTVGSSKPRDPMDYVEHDNDSMSSPLRMGKGLSVAPFFAEHKWFFQNTNFGDAQTWAEAIGIQARYSFGHTTTLFLEGAYQRFNSTAATSAIFTVQGMTSQLGVEFRLPLDGDYDNQLLLAPGLGFEYVVASSNNAGGPSVSSGAFVPRGRVGWRHMIQASAAFDLSLDLGVGSFRSFSNPSDFPFSCSVPGGCPETALVALNVALVWGL